MRVIPIAGTVGSAFHHYFEYYRRNVLDQYLNEELAERRGKMNVRNRLDTTSPDYLKFIEESKQSERKQETRNQMNEEREDIRKSTETVNRSNLGTIIDVYA
jgi:uncharacterized protein with von Willebrand factor type A (vWA) domain